MVEAIATAADDDPWRQQFRVAAAARDAAALRALSGKARRLPLPPSSLVLLSWHLFLRGEVDEALALLRWAPGRHLTDYWIPYCLGTGLSHDENQSPVVLEEAIGCLRTALALRPAAAAAHNNLGTALSYKNQWDEAMAEFRKAIDLDPKDAMAHDNLGIVLNRKNRRTRPLPNSARLSTSIPSSQ